MTNILGELNQLSTAPSQERDFNAWLELKDAVGFMNRNVLQDEFVVYASMPHVFVHAILVPTSLTNPLDVEDLMCWDCNATSSWGVAITFSEPRSIYISSPLADARSKTLRAGEQMVFARRFEGRVGRRNYYEILQKITQVLNIHFLPERSAYCRLDKNGDIEDVIRFLEVSGKGEDFIGSAVTFKRSLLDQYLALTGSTIIRTFDFTRFRPSHFGGWHKSHENQYVTEGALSYRVHVEPHHASYMRGFQVVHPVIAKETVIDNFDPTATVEKRYASFIAHDWKNKIVTEISCAPRRTANYFTQSDLPFELSPAFFRPEVLLKYKSDSEKYRLEDRSISCRSTWHLETYDINDAGQVHTYLVYLRGLPYEEQLYWKSFNERPKAPISKRAMKTDFEGSWETEYDPLGSLKEAVRELYDRQVPWWALRSEKLLDQVHYPVTSSPDEWSNEILQLDQLVVEGFQSKWLRKTAESLGRVPEPKFESLKLVEECLLGLGNSELDVQKLLAPLRETHHLRTKLKGHASGKDAAALKRQALEGHGTYKKHFRDLCGYCDESIRSISEQFKLAFG